MLCPVLMPLNPGVLVQVEGPTAGNHSRLSFTILPREAPAEHRASMVAELEAEADLSEAGRDQHSLVCAVGVEPDGRKVAVPRSARRLPLSPV